MKPILQCWKSILTNGETTIQLECSKENVSFDIPEGHVLLCDDKGNMHLDGKPLKTKFISIK